ncbi:MAG: c-type cytochrome [Candidatus Thiodiazotropha sp. (ex. Lucinoma kazani)]
MSRMLSKMFKFAAIVSVLGLISASAYAGNAFQGYALFNQSCFLCHGASGKGDGPLAKKLDDAPADLTDTEGSAAGTSDRQLFGLIQGTIKHGSGTSAMPQWGLAMPANQINSLVSYIRFMQRSKHTLPGDPRVGLQIYMDKCAACHGRSGKGDGPLAGVLNLKPQDHTNSAAMNKHPNSHLIEVVTHGTPGKSLMPGWKDMLSEAEIKGVVSYLRLLSAY